MEALPGANPQNQASRRVYLAIIEKLRMFFNIPLYLIDYEPVGIPACVMLYNICAKNAIFL